MMYLFFLVSRRFESHFDSFFLNLWCQPRVFRRRCVQSEVDRGNANPKRAIFRFYINSPTQAVFLCHQPRPKHDLEGLLRFDFHSGHDYMPNVSLASLRIDSLLPTSNEAYSSAPAKSSLVTVAIAADVEVAPAPSRTLESTMLGLDIASKRKRKISDYPYRLEYQLRW